MNSQGQDTFQTASEPDSVPTTVVSNCISAEPIALGNGPSIESLSIDPGSSTTASDSCLPAAGCSDVVPGLVGLQNIGNTCFMNSVLQCLLHCTPLCEYFLSGRFKDEINVDNPLGSGGRLAEEFSKLVNQFWRNPTERAVVPRDLKYVIGQKAPMFMGYQQQDSQELVTFLLDGLHEDLNLVKKKPYLEAIEGGDRPDALVARLCWDQHLMRNQSRIVDIFQGQFKSRLSCPHCSKSSVTFDPFMYLSLPIPSQPDLPLLVTFTNAQHDPPLPPVKLAINVFRDATDLPKAIAAAVASELPDEYSHETVADDIVVYTQSTTYNYFQQVDGSNFYSTSSLASKRRIFCTVLPRPPSPVITSVATEEEPSPKRHRYNTVTVCVQTRICPKSKWTSSASGGAAGLIAPAEGSAKKTFTPAVSYVPVGAPCAISVSNAMTLAELLQEIKRTVVYSVGPKSRELFQGLMSKDTLVRFTDASGCTVGSIPLSWRPPAEGAEDLAASASITVGSLCALFWQNSTEASTSVLPMLVVDVPVDDSTPEDGSESVSWDDIVSGIVSKVGESHKTEKSWKLTSVQSTTSSHSASTSSSAVSISDCFKLFSSEEVLGVSDQWYCSSCKMHVQASKKLDLWIMPDVLIVHLKRFQYARGFRNKIESIIDFPAKPGEVMDMTKFLPASAVAENTKSLKYKLFAVSNHMGSLYSGHYTAHAKNSGDGWHTFNDSYVSPMQGSPRPDSSAYLLFYQRCGEE